MERPTSNLLMRWKKLSLDCGKHEILVGQFNAFGTAGSPGSINDARGVAFCQCNFRDRTVPAHGTDKHFQIIETENPGNRKGRGVFYPLGESGRYNETGGFRMTDAGFNLVPGKIGQ